MNNKTVEKFKEVAASCKQVFQAKNRDYGLSWRILRVSSLTDQIYIKASRIRSLQSKQVSRVEEGMESEFIGIVNYSLMALIQIEKGVPNTIDMSYEEAMQLYEKYMENTMELMTNKNHDYDEAWRNMRISSITDIILMRIFRIKQIEENQGTTQVSEGLEANYQDIINYAIFALIKMQENEMS
ncbi:MAG: DUF1599 domain-containing protein [Bacteroidales bacterium]|nr:DUF1599 domain-containing protein [Bacteroidales bacterium]MCF8333199.1 DUF1599 domain-containing protein [Bacteroidales bacterium]